MTQMPGRVAGVSRGAVHAFSKQPVDHINLLEGRGVEGDAHCGTTVKHRSRVRRDPSQANLRQVHLLHSELFDELAEAGHLLRPGELGENVTTSGVDLLSLPTDTVLHLGAEAAVRVTGLRNPCSQIEAFQPRLLGMVLGRDEGGQVVRRSGIMAVVVRSGQVGAEDPVTVVLPDPPHGRLEPV